MLEKLVELLEPYMSGEACDAESGSCELSNCRTCDAIALANRLILNDVVPVVRCKDCKHRGNHEVCPLMDIRLCFDGDGHMDEVEDDKTEDELFCSYGERKDGD